MSLNQIEFSYIPPSQKCPHTNLLELCIVDFKHIKSTKKIFTENIFDRKFVYEYFSGEDVVRFFLKLYNT